VPGTLRCSEHINIAIACDLWNRICYSYSVLYSQSVRIEISLTFWGGEWGLNLQFTLAKYALSTTWATPPVHFPLFFWFLFFVFLRERWGLANYLSRLTSNHNPPDFSLPCS
jgi:hypothetical protein